MKIYGILLAVSIMLTAFISIPPLYGGKLESFLEPGEFVNAICGNDVVQGNLVNAELSVSERIQINCGMDQPIGVEVDKNITLQENESVKIICVPPTKSSEEVVIPIPLNNIQNVLCTSGN